jgi:hypothetical protein
MQALKACLCAVLRLILLRNKHTLWAMAERLLGTELAENEHFLDTNMLFKK